MGSTAPPPPPTARPGPLEGKVVLITGAGQGLGEAAARLAAGRGAAALSLSDAAADGVARLARALEEDHPGLRCLARTVDVRDPAQVEAWVAESAERLGRIDCCVNNAGTVSRAQTPIPESCPDDFARVLAVNLTGVYHCLRAQLGRVADGGSVVNLGSVAGLIGAPGWAAYAASKAGVVSLTKTAALEVGSRGVRVNAVCPSFANTPMFTDQIVPAWGGEDKTGSLPQAFRRLLEPDEIAGLILYLLGDESRFITGQAYRIDGGWNGLF